ncbi:syncytin-1-like [Moschus berezovskii]|uniref:syncytin-1-like n=1 Tax=Moschus berezovskii TaxID=68408 RepID=UPI002444F7D7|nr:syncytin-1-like [Moschus berezovskii]
MGLTKGLLPFASYPGGHLNYSLPSPPCICRPRGVASCTPLLSGARISCLLQLTIESLFLCNDLSLSLSDPSTGITVLAGNYTLKTNNTTESITQLIGPVADDVLLAASSNLTCLLNTSSSNISYYNDTHSCTSWAPWNSTSNCTSPGIFLLCGTYAYSCLPLDPTGWILVFLAPGLIFINEGDMDQIVDHHEGLPTKPPHRGWRAIVAPILIGTGIEIALGAGIGGISTFAHFYYKLSHELNEDMEQVVESLVSVQRQINSLATVALQNRWALDLITAEKGGTCLFLGEDCCYFVNEKGIVQGKIKELKDRIECRRKELQNFYNPQGLWHQFLPWLLSFLGPIMIIVILLLVGPCLVNLFQKFLQERIQTIS